MTFQEWQAQDKTPGTILYSSGGKGAGRLVSYIQYGATLDFTKGEASHVDRAYYPFQMLSKTPEAATASLPKPKQKRGGKRPTIAVKCVETGEIYSSITQAAKFLHVSHTTIRDAIMKYSRVKGFLFIEAD